MYIFESLLKLDHHVVGLVSFSISHQQNLDEVQANLLDTTENPDAVNWI